jgi:2-polyprenyl-6-methoxyphenol hydroxylase-like FAD-dependent oxidoreductase
MRVAVIGGSAAGLFTALLLARAGHEVVVLDRDPVDPPPDAESAAAAAFRAAAPQIVQPHVVLALGRELLRGRLPDLYRELLAAGVAEAPLASQMPPSLPDRSAWPGDERLTMLMTRRSTLDWVLRRLAVAQPGVTLRGRVLVTGLVTQPGQPPRVTGVRTGAAEVPADLVVDAAGRRSPVDGWLAAAGARPPATQAAECGLAYYSRHYRLRPGADLPGLPTTRIVAGLDEFTVGIWGGDNGTMLLCVAPLAADKRFRAVRDPAVFTAVLRTVPIYAAWLDVLDPISPVFPMGGLHNTLRRLVAGGSPVATGLHAVGDSVCTTNPTLGRGLSLALRGAADLADALAEHGERTPGLELAMDLDQRAGQHIAPCYTDQAEIDAARLAAQRHTIFGAPAPPPAVSDGRVSYAELRRAAPHDPLIFRAFWQVMGVACPPGEMYADPAIVARTQQINRSLGSAPPLAQPTREQLLAALGSAG